MFIIVYLRCARLYISLLAAFFLLGPSLLSAKHWAEPEKVDAVARGELKEAYAHWWGYDPEDSTTYLQAALDSGVSRLIISAMEGPWIVEPLFIKGDDLEVVFEAGAVIEAKRGAFRGKNDSLLTIEERKNIRLIGRGAVFRMHKEDYWAPPYAKAEWRNTLAVRGAEGIHIEGITFYNSGGDGIYLGATREHPYVKDVVIRAVVCDANNRQGLSVISADNLLVEQSVFSNTIGTAPMAGIDLEPNRSNQRMKDVVIRNNLFLNNSQLGMHMWLSCLNEESEPISITIENNTIIGGEIGIHLASFRDNGPGGFVDIRGNRILNSRHAGILVRRISTESGVEVYFTDNVLWNTSHQEPHSAEVIDIYQRAMGTKPNWWGGNSAAVVLTAQRDIPQYQGGVSFSGDVVFHYSDQPVIRMIGTSGQRWVERFANEDENKQPETGFLGWKNVWGEFLVVGSGSREVEITSPTTDVDLRIVALPRGQADGRVER